MATLEVHAPLHGTIAELEGARCVVGTGSDGDIVIDSDAAVSRLHLVLEQIGRTWVIRDLHSRNGTYVNHERLVGERPLRDGDEILLGRTRLLFHDPTQSIDPQTETLQPPPMLTRRERDVLVELCRPLLGGNAFTQPASVRDIAAALVVVPAAVKQHLSRLYDKFGIYADDGDSRRVRLANAALGRGAVTLSDIRAHAGS
jgi:DNA-binding transcriptional ArsR family regulator